MTLRRRTWSLLPPHTPLCLLSSWVRLLQPLSRHLDNCLKTSSRSWSIGDNGFWFRRKKQRGGGDFQLSNPSGLYGYYPFRFEQRIGQVSGIGIIRKNASVFTRCSSMTGCPSYKRNSCECLFLILAPPIPQLANSPSPFIYYSARLKIDFLSIHWCFYFFYIAI